jgi:hypothetical protein
MVRWPAEWLPPPPTILALVLKGSLRLLLAKLSRIDVLVIDD